MARLSLATRAARYGTFLNSDPGSLSTRNRGERDKLLRAMGISASQWDSYAPSTRRKYLNAAKRGQSASDERSRVREQRKNRPKQRGRRKGLGLKSKRDEIEELRQRLVNEGMDTSQGLGDVETDELDSAVLLSRSAVDDHIRYYGEDYVLKHLTEMWDTLDQYLQGNRDVGTFRWRRFKATPLYRRNEDERWFWYHPSPYAM